MVLLTGSAAGAPTTSMPPRTKAMKREEDGGDEGVELRRGPWTVDEDLTLINYIAEHGDGRWNALARAAGLKRTGKSCRLRWLNYLRPDVKRGDFTADEQLLILDLHSRWGNRWSKIAQHLPGRTDNEIKNYWRTRVQKHARQLNCDVNSRRFRDAMTYLWMPRLAERAGAAASAAERPVVGFVPGNNSVNAAAAATCHPELATTTTPVADSNTTTIITSGCFLAAENSPGGSASGSSCGVVPSSSSSDSSLTSTDSTTAHHEEKSVHQLPHGTGADFWTTLQGAHDNEFWSTATAAAPSLEHELHDMQDITGWVQGFSEGISGAVDDHSSLWSLDDIWRMQ